MKNAGSKSCGKAFREVFGSLPHSIKTYLKKERKHYVFKVTMDSRREFEWFDNENLDAFTVKYPLEYLSELF